MRILIAEDDKNTRDGLAEIFKGEGYSVVTATDGIDAVKQFTESKPDIVCLDIMMPKLNGYDVCKKIRNQDSDVPVIFISAKSEEIDKVLGLELGADDYIIKPFGVKEVIARIRAVSRRALSSGSRTNGEKQVPFTMKDIKVVPSELRVYRNEHAIDLSHRDIAILQLLYKKKGTVLDRNTIFDECWGADYIPSSRTLDQHISQLRKKIEVDPRRPRIIKTVQGVGYRFE